MGESVNSPFQDPLPSGDNRNAYAATMYTGVQEQLKTVPTRLDDAMKRLSHPEPFSMSTPELIVDGEWRNLEVYANMALGFTSDNRDPNDLIQKLTALSQQHPSPEHQQAINNIYQVLPILLRYYVSAGRADIAIDRGINLGISDAILFAACKEGITHNIQFTNTEFDNPQGISDEIKPQNIINRGIRALLHSSPDKLDTFLEIMTQDSSPELMQALGRALELEISSGLSDEQIMMLVNTAKKYQIPLYS